MIPEGIFQTADQQPVAQATISQIGTDTQGVVAVQFHEAKPYLQMTKPISSKALALLILDFHHEELKQCGTVTRFPTRSTSTNEPMIVSAKMVQLGASPISRSQPTQKIAMEEADTVVIRIHAFRDEVSIPWDTFAMRPSYRS